MSRELETIIWDLDGTLIDSFGIFQEVLGNIVSIHGIQMPSIEILAENYHGSLDDSIHNALGGNLPAAVLTEIVKEFLVIQNTHYEIIDHHFFADALRLAERAHEARIRQILVTNRNHDGREYGSPRSIVARSDLKNYIDVIICGEDSEHRKPKPEVLGDLVKLGKVKAETTLVVGDQFVDGEFAMNLGARGVLVDREGQGIVHIGRLGNKWQDHIDIVKSLDEVEV